MILLAQLLLVLQSVLVEADHFCLILWQNTPFLDTAWIPSFLLSTQALYTSLKLSKDGIYL